MIRVAAAEQFGCADNIWVGDSHSAKNACAAGVRSVLNVAQDLAVFEGPLWPLVEHMHVGLIDGPGNALTAYYAAVLALASLRRRTGRSGTTLVVCHSGGRALAVAAMYLNAMNQRGWGPWIDTIQERVEVDLPRVHEAHIEAFERMDWALLWGMLK